MLAQALGVVAADRGLAPGGAATAAAAVAIVVAAATARRGALPSLCALGVAFFCIGAAAPGRLALDRGEASAWPVGARATLEARIEGVRALPGRLRVDLGAIRPVDVRADAARPRVPPRGRIRLWVEADAPAHRLLAGCRAGDRLRLRASIRPLDGPRNPGAPDRRTPALRRGVWADATLAHPDAVVRLGPSDAGRSIALGARARRGAAIERLQAHGVGGGVLAALGLGAADGLDPGLRAALARMGLAHLVAVSGLHLALVAALAFAGVGLVARLVGAAHSGAIDPVSWKAAAAVLAAGGYAWLTGLGVPARRALVLLALAVALHASGRRSAWLAAWCVAASAVLGVDPAALFELGPQLSFAVTAALAAARLDVAPPPEGEAGRLARVLAAGLRLLEVSAVALAASAPILALHGRPSSGIALLANVLAVPVTALALLPASLFAAALALAGPPGNGAVESALAAAAWGAERLAIGVERAAAGLGAPAPTASPGPPVVGLALALGCTALVLRAPTPSLRGAAALACLAALGLEGPPAAAVRGDASPRPGAELVALDVGQGDALLLRGASGAVLVDAGWADPAGGWDAGARVVVPALRALGVRRLDLLVVTHADLDHRGGVPAVLDALPVDRLWLPAPSADAPGFAALRALAGRRGTRVEPRARDAPIERVGGFEVEVLWPPARHAPTAPNESSLVLRVASGGTRVLLMGDAGREVERRLLVEARERLEASVLKLGHHGSRGASSDAWLDAVRPVFAVVSAGCGVRRALPDPGTLERVEGRGARVLWTGRDGAVRLALAPRPVRVAATPARAPRRCRARPRAPLALPLPEPSRRVGRLGNDPAQAGVGGGEPAARVPARALRVRARREQS